MPWLTQVGKQEERYQNENTVQFQDLCNPWESKKAVNRNQRMFFLKGVVLDSHTMNFRLPHTKLSNGWCWILLDCIMVTEASPDFRDWLIRSLGVWFSPSAHLQVMKPVSYV